MRETIVDLMRHGEPEGGSLYRGNSIDDPLTEKGWQQMWSAIGENAPWELIVSSPMQRCYTFAQALAKKLNIPLQIVDDLKEIGFGSWEGKTRDEVKQINQQAYDAFYRDPVNCRPEGAEDLGKFFTRVSVAYQNVVDSNLGKHILIVAHAGVNRAIISQILGAGGTGIYRMQMGNGKISRIRHKRYGPMLEFHNIRLGALD